MLFLMICKLKRFIELVLKNDITATVFSEQIIFFFFYDQT